MQIDRDTMASLASCTALAMVLVLPHAAAAQDADQLAKQTQNPVSSLISVPLQGNWDFGLGDRDTTGTLLNIQPVMPFGISASTNVILRVIMPLASQPGPDGTRINGMGDIVATAFFSPAKSGRIIWGVGPVVLLPAATNNALGSEKFGLGPSVVLLAQPGQWTLGVLFNQIWSMSGANDRSDVNQTFLQPFANYNLGGGLVGGRQCGGLGELESGRDVDGAPALQRQQGHAARQAAGEFRGGRRSDPGQSRRWRQLALSPGRDLPVPAVTSRLAIAFSVRRAAIGSLDDEDGMSVDSQPAVTARAVPRPPVANAATGQQNRPFGGPRRPRRTGRRFALRTT